MWEDIKSNNGQDILNTDNIILHDLCLMILEKIWQTTFSCEDDEINRFK